MILTQLTDRTKVLLTMVLSLEWSELLELQELVRNIEISFVVFTVLCTIGILPSVARRAAEKKR